MKTLEKTLFSILETAYQDGDSMQWQIYQQLIKSYAIHLGRMKMLEADEHLTWEDFIQAAFPKPEEDDIYNALSGED